MKVLAQVAALLIAIAGVWLFLSQILSADWLHFRLEVVGVLLTAAGVLLVIVFRSRKWQ